MKTAAAMHHGGSKKTGERVDMPAREGLTGPKDCNSNL